MQQRLFRIIQSRSYIIRSNVNVETIENGAKTIENAAETIGVVLIT